MSDELKPCPLCKSERIGGAIDTVTCLDCGLNLRRPRPLANAVAAWNTRPAQAAQVPDGMAAVPCDEATAASVWLTTCASNIEAGFSQWERDEMRRIAALLAAAPAATVATEARQESAIAPGMYQDTEGKVPARIGDPVALVVQADPFARQAVATEDVAQECDCGDTEYCESCFEQYNDYCRQRAVAQGGGVDVEKVMGLVEEYGEQCEAEGYLERSGSQDAAKKLRESAYQTAVKIRALLTAAPAGVGGWQPIETAPRSPYGGCLVYNDKGISQVYWDPEENWWYMSDGKNDYPLRGNEPTHWQPLPAAPAIANQESGHD